MKQVLFIALLSSISLFSLGINENDSTNSNRKNFVRKGYKNSIAVDMTALLGQFFNLNDNYYYYSPGYMVTYRRFIGRYAIRFDAGGNVSTDHSVTSDTVKSDQNRTTYAFALGFESYKRIMNRWSYYFGIDLTTSYRLNYGRNQSAPDRGSEYSSDVRSFGVSPLLGILFRINRRMSVSTETSYNISYVVSTDRKIYYPDPKYNSNTNSTGIESTFFPPVNISFRLKF
jgi:hypothetical protein